MHELTKAELLIHAITTSTVHPHLVMLQAAVILAWQPVEVIWSDPQVLAYLNGPDPTHERELKSQPDVRSTLGRTYQALNVFERVLCELTEQPEEERHSAFAALVESQVLLVLARIAHWLQETPQPAVLDFAAQKWFGALLWHLASELLSVMVSLERLEERQYPQLCAQLLASGE